MKTIVKHETALDCLQVAENNGWNWDAFHQYSQKGYKAVLGKALECQRYECAYTGLWIGEGTSQTVHLDHFRKKSIYPEETFCWHNLFAAVKDVDYGSDYKDKQIHGTKLDAEKLYKKFWSPLQANLEDSFWYRQDGTIEPMAHLSESEKEEAEQTIRIYNLNAHDLKNKRRGIILQVGGIMQQLSDEDIRSCMNTSGFSFLVDFELKQRHLELTANNNCKGCD